jgi:hypothetical protein
MDDPIMDDPMYWKYQGLAEGLYKTLKNSPDLFHDGKLFMQVSAHFAKKLYMMGYEDAAADYEPSLPLDESRLVEKKKRRIN